MRLAISRAPLSAVLTKPAMIRHPASTSTSLATTLLASPAMIDHIAVPSASLGILGLVVGRADQDALPAMINHIGRVVGSVEPATTNWPRHHHCRHKTRSASPATIDHIGGLAGRNGYIAQPYDTKAPQ